MNVSDTAEKDGQLIGTFRWWKKQTVYAWQNYNYTPRTHTGLLIYKSLSFVERLVLEDTTIIFIGNRPRQASDQLSYRGGQDRLDSVRVMWRGQDLRFWCTVHLSVVPRYAFWGAKPLFGFKTKLISRLKKYMQSITLYWKLTKTIPDHEMTATFIHRKPSRNADL